MGGAQPNEGRVQIYYQSEWGAVCSNRWDFQDGRVACRQLGFVDLARATDNEFGNIEANERVWLDELNCTGQEHSLHKCPSSGFYKATCYEDRPAGVVCTGETADVLYSDTTCFNTPQYDDHVTQLTCLPY